MKSFQKLKFQSTLQEQFWDLLLVYVYFRTMSTLLLLPIHLSIYNFYAVIQSTNQKRQFSGQLSFVFLFSSNTSLFRGLSKQLSFLSTSNHFCLLLPHKASPIVKQVCNFFLQQQKASVFFYSIVNSFTFCIWFGSTRNSCKFILLLSILA